MAAERRSQLQRRTKETEVAVRLSLDGSGVSEAATGIGFMDHMLNSLAAHARFDLHLQAAGDLHVDLHHTVEDVAALLGQALDEALGDRSGIERFGHAVIPMDESVAAVALDCSGRGLAVVRVAFPAPSVGGVPASLLCHFFEVFARSARITLNLKGEGRDDHHLAEAMFKATGRALKQAVRRDPALEGSVPSTKGTL